MNANSRWTGWDGRRLSWQSVPDAELCIDGVRFEPVAAADEAREFPSPPSGDAHIEFSLRDAQGTLLGTPWRVLHGHSARCGSDTWSGATHALRPLPLPDVGAATPPARVSIVVPIYNSPQCVQRCIEALLRWTPAPARLILIDDASTDPAIAVLLAHFAHVSNVVVHRNAQNLGYTRSSNFGMQLAEKDDVVLLNSDTEVGPCWLPTLRRAAYASDDLGTATAVSDNAGAFSVPELEQFCPIPARWDLAQTQRALLHHAGNCRPELPTGNGFCMYVKRTLLDRVGFYDAQAFPFGYGEENDLCQRAARAGLRHVIAGDVFVRHARSASFGAERRTMLGAQGMQVLRERYPDYEAQVGAALFCFTRRVLDYRVRRLYAGIDPFHATHPPRPRVLLAGRAVTLAETLRASHECIAVTRRGVGVELRCLEHSDACLAMTRADEHAVSLAAALQANTIETLHLHGDADLPLTAAARACGVPVVDTSADDSYVAERALADNAHVAARCLRLYRAAWRTQAAFPAFAVGNDE